MARKSDSVRYSIKDVTDSSVLIVDGINVEFQIGLGKDGSLCSNCSGDQTIIVPLVQLSISSTGGLTASPGNKDLLCLVNGEVLRSEVNIISGSVINIADKKFQIFEGDPKKAKRKLPQTPGVTARKKPPPKPKRTGDEVNSPKSEQHEESGKNEKLRESWEVIKHPEVDTEILANLKSPLELGCLAASFLTKQIHHYTDCRLSTETTDQIFKFLQEVAGYQRGILMEYLTETSEKLEEMPEAERDRPIHRPAVKLLVELLRQILDPLSHVKLCLTLLRTFSHFPGNLETMVSCQATPAILGCMAVYLEEVEVQRCSLEILAKIALYKPRLQEKLPLRETALELILRALNRYQDNVEIIQPGCRTLSSLTSNMQDILESLIDMDADPDVDAAVERYTNLLNHTFAESTQIMQKFLQTFNNDISIKMDGRRFLFGYSKMTQILIKKNNRNNPKSDDNDDIEADDENPLPEVDDGHTSEDSTSTKQTDIDLPKQVALLKIQDENAETRGILKKDGSMNDLQDVERKVHFVDEEGECSSDYTSSEEGDEDNIQNNSDEDGPILEIQKTKLLTSIELSSGAFGMTEHLDNEEENETHVLTESNENKPDESEDEHDYENVESLNKKDQEKDDAHLSTLELNEDEQYEPSQTEDTEGENTTDSKFLVNSVKGSFENSNSDVSITEPLNQDGDSDDHQESVSLIRQGSFLASDVEFLTKTLYLVIIHYASALVYEGNDALALAIIDQPLVFLAEKCGATKQLLKFAQEKFERSKTLMDIDPTFLISVIDALRYKSLLNELLQNTILEVVESFDEDHGSESVTLALITLLNVVGDETLHIPVTSDKNFVTKFETVLKKSEKKLQNFPEMLKLKKKLALTED